MKSKIKTHLLILLAAGIFYTILSIIPHWNFQTNAFDLGIFNQTLQQYAHLQLGPNTVREVPTLLADHMEVLLFLFSPFYWIFGSYTLLILQILFVLFGALGCYLLVKHETKKEFLALSSMTIFLLFFGLVTAMAFDYHNNVIAAMLIPWLFYTFSLRKFGWYYLILVGFLFSKENMALITSFLGLSLIIFEEKKYKKHGVITLILSVVYFLAVLKIIAYLNGGSYSHWSYDALGKTPFDALKNIFSHPFQTLQLFFDDEAKIKSWILLLLSGGFLAAFKPKYALLLIPILARKFFSSDAGYWGFIFHYSVEFTAIIALGSILAISKLPKIVWQKIAAYGLVVINLLILGNIHFYNGDSIFGIFQGEYYRGSENKPELQIAINMTKNSSAVSAQNTFVPHLKNKEIYLFPKISDSEYILLDKNSKSTWPFRTQDELLKAIKKLDENRKYNRIFEQKGVYVYKKIQ